MKLIVYTQVLSCIAILTLWYVVESMSTKVAGLEARLILLESRYQVQRIDIQKLQTKTGVEPTEPQ